MWATILVALLAAEVAPHQIAAGQQAAETVAAIQIQGNTVTPDEEMRQRFASIEDPSQITLVIVVDEGPVKIVMTGDPDRPTKVVRKRLPTLMPYPILGR